MKTPETPLRPSDILSHLHANGLLREFDVAALVRAGTAALERPVEDITESDVLELLWRHYGPGTVIGVAANAHAVRDAVMLFKENHDLDEDEEITARREIGEVVAPFGVTLTEDDLEDLGDDSHVARAIDRGLQAAGRPERVHIGEPPVKGTVIVLIREQLVPGPLGFCAPRA